MANPRSILSQLSRPEVTELSFASGQRPLFKSGEASDEVWPEPFHNDDILQVLFAAGGSRYVESLGPRPVQWTTRVGGAHVTVSASMHADGVTARLSVVRRGEGGTGKPAAKLLVAQGADEVPAVVRAESDRQRPQPPILQISIATPPDRPAVDHSLDSLDAAFRLDTAPKSRRGAPRKAAAAKGHPPDTSEMTRAITLPEMTPPRSRRGGARARAPSSKDSPTEAPDIEVSIVTHDVAPETRRAGVRKPAVAGRARDIAPAGLKDVDAPPPPTLGRSRRGASHGAAWDGLLAMARQAGASDLHVIAGRPPLVRIAGSLLPRGDVIDAKTVEAMVLPRVPARLNETLERDGSCDFALESPNAGRFRVNIARQRTGLKACVRLIPAEIPTLAALGLPDAIGLCTRHHQGLVVLTGPTGHGKTSTLAAVVDIINRESSHHVITVEDPVEHIHPRKQAMMSQREVGTHTRSFASALKASLREDPDVIVVGELRDTETVRMALAASETGHLVLGTMNTPSAAKTIDRLIDLFPPADQQQVRVTLAGALKLLVSQRLLPTMDGTSMVVAVELLPGSVALGNLIRDSRTFQIASLMQRGKALGIVRLDDSLAELVRARKTTLEAALAVAEAPDELRAACMAPAAKRAAPEPALDPPGRGLLAKAGALFGKKGS
jgi:twitching motility protein PilT